MTHIYHLNIAYAVPTPALVWYRDLIERNLAWAIDKVGDPTRLRPHCKTHKSAKIIAMQRALGVSKHKCSTIAEAEMLAQAGASDILLSYPLVGPNVKRFARLMESFPETCFAALVDHVDGLNALKPMFNKERPLSVYLDLDVGMNRTGIPISDSALSLAHAIESTPGIMLSGLHAYDGHNRQPSIDERTMACDAVLENVIAFRNKLHPDLPIVIGGTPSFPMYAAHTEVPNLECSPGTYVLHDHGYGSTFPDFAELSAAAIVLTRVVSRPTPTRITFDLGNKAIAADPPADKRVHLIEIPDYKIVTHSEEHLVIETPHADRWSIGTITYAIPWHVCPTSALYPNALIAVNGQLIDRWPIDARNRVLTI